MNSLEKVLIHTGFAIITANIIIYILLSCSLFIIFIQSKTFSFNQLNTIKDLTPVWIEFVIVYSLILSLSGVPPFIGFTGKFLLQLHLLAHKSFLLFLLFLIFNIFIMYFYFRNIHDLAAKPLKSQPKTKIDEKSFSVNNYSFIYAFLSFVLFFNIFGIFYFENILLFINYWFSLI